MDRVLASVDGRIVTERDIRYRVLEARLRDADLWREPEEMLSELLVTEAVDDLLLWLHFWRAEIEPDDAAAQARADERWKEWSRLAGNEWELGKRIADSGLREEEVRVWLKEEAKRDLATERAIGARLDQSLLNREETAADIRRVRLAHILVVPDDATDLAKADAEQRALRIRLHLEEGFEFERAAAIFSDDKATAKTGGDLGWIEPAKLDSTVRDAIVGLQPGESTRPVAMADGWHLFRVGNVETAARAELAETVEALKLGALRQLRSEKEVTLAQGLKLLPLPGEMTNASQAGAGEPQD